MDSKSTFAVLAFLFSASLYVFYVKAVIKNDARPTTSSWISWLIMDTVIFAGIIAAGEMVWQMVPYIIGCIVVIGVSTWKGAAVGWTRLDSTCLAIVIVAVGLWSVSGDPNLTIVLSLVAITIGTAPMLVNVWQIPEREPLLPWLLCMVGGAFGVLAIPTWNTAAALTPAWYFTLQVSMVFLISRKLYKTKDAIAL